MITLTAANYAEFANRVAQTSGDDDYTIQQTGNIVWPAATTLTVPAGAPGKTLTFEKTGAFTIDMAALTFNDVWPALPAQPTIYNGMEFSNRSNIHVDGLEFLNYDGGAVLLKFQSGCSNVTVDAIFRDCCAIEHTTRIPYGPAIVASDTWNGAVIGGTVTGLTIADSTEFHGCCIGNSYQHCVYVGGSGHEYGSILFDGCGSMFTLGGVTSLDVDGVVVQDSVQVTQAKTGNPSYPPVFYVRWMNAVSVHNCEVVGPIYQWFLGSPGAAFNPAIHDVDDNDFSETQWVTINNVFLPLSQVTVADQATTITQWQTQGLDVHSAFEPTEENMANKYANNGLFFAVGAEGTAQGGGADTITLTAGASDVNGIFNFGGIRIVGGTGAGQQRVVINYDGTTKIAQVGQMDGPIPESLPWDVEPDETSEYEITIGSDLFNGDGPSGFDGVDGAFATLEKAEAESAVLDTITLTWHGRSYGGGSETLINVTGSTTVAGRIQNDE